MSVRDINARDVIADLNAGMDDIGLMKKYRLSAMWVQSLFKKLLAAGLVAPNEVQQRRTRIEGTVNLTGLTTAVTEQKRSGKPAPKAIRYLFSGMVKDIDILDYLHFLLTSTSKTVLEVQLEEGSISRLFIDKGRILHATSGHLEGEEAFYCCTQSTGGVFTHLPWEEPEERTIRRSGDFLLLEAARRRDERSAGGL